MTQTHETSAAKTQGNSIPAEPVNLLKRIGSTTYVVNVHFSKTSTETMEDKLFRIIASDIEKDALSAPKREVSDVA